MPATTNPSDPRIIDLGVTLGEMPDVQNALMQAELRGFLSDSQNSEWAMDLARLGALLKGAMEVMGQPGDVKALEHGLDFSVADKTATIVISGTLMKSVPSWMRYWGFDATGYDEIAAAVSRAAADPSVEKILLRISSPGGQVSGVEDAANAIFEAKAVKPVIAHIEDLGASAAYWLASQATEITASELSLVGSIGVYTVMRDFSAMAEQDGVKVHIIRSGEFKGAGVFGAAVEPQHLQAKQEIVDKIAEKFTGAVARGRGKSNAVVTEWASGKIWMAEDAKALGLIDGVETLASVLAAPATPTMERNLGMAVQNDAGALDAEKIRAEAEKQGAENAQKRLEALVTGLGDSALAMEHFKQGHDVEQAKAAHYDVLKANLAAANTKIKELEASAAAEPPEEPEGHAAGAPPVFAGGDGENPDASGEAVTFASEVKRYRAEHNNCDASVAARAVAKKNPELREACIAAANPSA